MQNIKTQSNKPFFAIIGAFGFIGKEISGHFEKKRVILIGRKNKKRLHSFFLKKGQKCVIYLAAYSPPKKPNIEKAISQNVLFLSKTIKKIHNKIDTFIYFSTSKIRDHSCLDQIQKEREKYYYLSKHIAELLLIDNSHKFKKLLILKIPSVIGDSFQKNNISLLLKNCRENKKVTVPMDKRPFNACTNIKDLFMCCAAAFENSKSWVKKLDVGASNSLSLYKIAKMLSRKNKGVSLSSNLNTSRLQTCRQTEKFLNVRLSSVQSILNI